MIRSGVIHAAHAASNEFESVTTPTHRPVTVPANIQVKLDTLSGCGACSASGGCGVQLLPVQQASLIVDCQLPVGHFVSVGDKVRVQLPDPGKGWLRIVSYAYGIPTLGMIFGALTGYWGALALNMPQFTDTFSLAGFVAGLGGGLIAWTRAEKSVQVRYAGKSQPQIPKIIQET